MPDATGLELTAHELRDANADSILGTEFQRGRATLNANPPHVVEVLTTLYEKGYSFLASLHGVDYYPHEPRLGVIYELLDMKNVDRITVKARVPIDEPADQLGCRPVPRRQSPRARGLRHVRSGVRRAS